MHLAKKNHSHAHTHKEKEKRKGLQNIQFLNDNCLVEVMRSVMESSIKIYSKEELPAGRIQNPLPQGISITYSASFPWRKALQVNSTFKQNQSEAPFFSTSCEKMQYPNYYK